MAEIQQAAVGQTIQREDFVQVLVSFARHVLADVDAWPAEGRVGEGRAEPRNVTHATLGRQPHRPHAPPALHRAPLEVRNVASPFHQRAAQRERYCVAEHRAVDVFALGRLFRGRVNAQ